MAKGVITPLKGVRISVNLALGLFTIAHVSVKSCEEPLQGRAGSKWQRFIQQGQRQSCTRLLRVTEDSSMTRGQPGGVLQGRKDPMIAERTDSIVTPWFGITIMQTLSSLEEADGRQCLYHR
ncbi:hypothetical protein JZ751_002702 [Albula glossodonta]|uniref:Uncharacterized protein n=1 Tax=Albula glossodonta TaxID=121402 RepID=A0A8T2N7M0_9TELE|nr:hypothetical protein JZ751_002702 [Albula glossodonta]